MWISKQLSGACGQVRTAKTGEVTSALEGAVTVQSEQEHREIPIAAPFGIISIPPNGSKAVVTPTEQGFVYTGTLNQQSDGLEPGELMLYSCGGAKIVLKNDGKVLINGKELG